MSALLTELKTRARLRLNATRDTQPALTLRHCLNQVARDVGFAHWEHGRRVLSGAATPGEDMGTFWHAPACHALLNAWFAQAQPAREALARMPDAVLLPYRRQFVVVGAPYVRALGLDPADPDWHAAERDLVRAYGTAAWLALARRRLEAPAAGQGASSRSSRSVVG